MGTIHGVLADSASFRHFMLRNSQTSEHIFKSCVDSSLSFLYGVCHAFSWTQSREFLSCNSLMWNAKLPLTLDNIRSRVREGSKPIPTGFTKLQKAIR